MPNALARMALEDKLSSEMEHKPLADINTLRGRNVLTDWALGIRDAFIDPAGTFVNNLRESPFLNTLNNIRQTKNLDEARKYDQDIANAMMGFGVVGMTKSALGRIAENGADTKKLAGMLKRAGEKKGYNVSLEGSAVSPSQYVTFRKAGDEIGDLTRQVRISNHADKYPELASGVRYSTDPATENTYEQAVNWLAKEGFPTNLSARYANIPTAEGFYKAQQLSRELPENRLNQLISAWRNQPKATRGEMPTIEDVKRLYQID